MMIGDSAENLLKHQQHQQEKQTQQQQIQQQQQQQLGVLESCHPCGLHDGAGQVEQDFILRPPPLPPHNDTEGRATDSLVAEIRVDGQKSKNL